MLFEVAKEFLQCEENLGEYVRANGKLQGRRLTSSIIVVDRLALVYTENALELCVSLAQKSRQNCTYSVCGIIGLLGRHMAL
jgi:hypothetical protein